MRLSLASLALLAPAALSIPLSDDLDDTPLPLVIWHGLGDSFAGDGIKEVGELAEAIHDGTFVYTIGIGADANADRSASFWGNVTEQIAEVCAALAAHPILSTAPAIDALGFSQGGVFLRGYVERCNVPPVRSLVTFGSPHNGIVDFAACGPNDWVCKGAMALLKTNTWSNYVQARLVPAQYYRNTDPETGGPSEEYLEHSNFLADINNERVLKNTSYAGNLRKLKNFVMYMFEDDTTVSPKESSWFADVNLTDASVTPLRERNIYKQDWLGLKTLDKNGGIVFKTTPGKHMELSDKVLNSTFKSFFGPFKSKAERKLIVQNQINFEL
ncbi:alpha/beta-hydrolase [Microthyrium microscopicum]|uniref:Palmitoyl-protein thioesterase 1 n=1 Tax=Microthyrium microscopicum TaxID=703497 RepID=A0A6A6UAN9_9PEZI|nr:alpha/beta-hydrolase [Microthyrium microscopicum]